MTTGTQHRQRRRSSMHTSTPQAKSLPPSTPPTKTKTTSSPSRTPVTVNTKKKKLCSTMALLDQYQEDDDDNLTTQLLYSIRSWNLDRPSSSFDNDGTCDGSNSAGCCSSTVLTKNSAGGCHASTATATTTALDDFATVTTASTANNNEIVLWNGSQSSTTPQQHKHLQEPEYKTPCPGNYSSRPSFLTEKILEDDVSASSHEETMLVASSTLSSTESPLNSPTNMPLAILEDESSYDSHNFHRHREGVPTNDQRRNVPSRVRFLEEEQYQQQQLQNQHYQRQRDHSAVDDTEHAQEPQCQQYRTPVTKNIAPRKASTEQEDHGTQRSRKHKDTNIQEERKSQEDEPQQDDAMNTLLEIAKSLGLSPNNVGAVLPTVRKLVRVVKIHVPRLETFVESVCQVVETDNGHNDDEGGNATDNGGDIERNARGKNPNADEQGESRENQGTSKQNQKKQTRRKGKKAAKNMEARRKRMTNVVSVLREEWPNRSATATDISKCDVQSHDCQKKSDSSSLSQRISSESAFCRAVIERLNQRHEKQVAQIVDDVLESSNPNNSRPSSSPTANISADIDDIDDALDSIDELIRFEERCHRIETIQKLVISTPTPQFQSPSSAFSPKSPTNSEDIIEELLAADATTLRKTVLHFAYLFSVRQDEMRLKMNELYHFSHEAGALISTVRKAIGVSVNCPLSTVSRRVVDAMHRDLSHSGSAELSHRF